jgi:hypothetical protein
LSWLFTLYLEGGARCYAHAQTKDEQQAWIRQLTRDWPEGKNDVYAGRWLQFPVRGKVGLSGASPNSIQWVDRTRVLHFVVEEE